MTSKGHCRFNEHWLKDVKYEAWIAKVDTRTAKCTVCCKQINLSNMGEGALKSHAKCRRHVSNMRIRTRTAADNMLMPTFLNQHEKNNTKATDEPGIMEPGLAKGQRTLVGTAGVSSKMTLESEIIWCLKLIESHSSYKSSEDTGGHTARLYLIQ